MDKFDTTCRTCNTIRSNLVNLNSNLPGNDTIKLCDVLSYVCPSISIQINDKLPQKICFFCSKQLLIARKFQLQCAKSYEELWKVVKDTIKDEPPLEKSIEFDEDSLGNEQIEGNDEISYPEEVFEETATPNGSPEFLEDDEADMEMLAHADPVEGEETSISHIDAVEPSFDCNLCAKKYLTSNGLLLHMKLSHKNIKTISNETFQCRYCNQVFASKNDQIEHTHSDHKNDSKSELTCHICHKTFIGKNKLDHHLLYHEKNQFQCLVKDCKRTFNIKYKLTDHMKRFHGIVLTTNRTKILKPVSVIEL